MKKAICLLAAALLLVGCSQRDKPCPCRASVTVIAFTAEWCAPCKLAMPALLSMKADGINIQIVDIDRFPGIAKKYGIKSVPTYVVRTKDCKTTTTSDLSAVINLTRG